MQRSVPRLTGRIRPRSTAADPPRHDVWAAHAAVAATGGLSGAAFYYAVTRRLVSFPQLPTPAAAAPLPSPELSAALPAMHAAVLKECYASELGDTALPAVARALELRADVNERSGGTAGGATALHVAAARAAPPRTVAALLSAGADVEAADPRGFRPLHAAALSGSPGLCLMLVSLGGADPNSRTSDGRTAAAIAAAHGHAAATEALLAAGAVADGATVRAAVNAPPSPEHEATLAVVLAKLGAGAADAVRAKDPAQGATAVHLAAAHGRREAVEALLAVAGPAAAADLDRAGLSPAHWALSRLNMNVFEPTACAHTEVLAALLAHAPETANTKSRKHRTTPVFDAAAALSRGGKSAAKAFSLLVDAGADTERAQGKFGLTALDALWLGWKAENLALDLTISAGKGGEVGLRLPRVLPRWLERKLGGAGRAPR